MTTIRAVVEYDGTELCGFQYQPGVRTVGAELERVSSKLLGHDVKVTAAGRTDAGVHATGQVVSFKTDAAFPFERFAIAANSELPGDIAIREAAIVDDAFSARFSAKERAYVYAIVNRAERAPLLARYAYRVWGDLDLDRAAQAAAHLLGTHDFRSFCGALPESGPTERTIRKLTLARRGGLVRLEVRADGFLHHMVRTIVGTLIECAVGRRAPDSPSQMLAAKDRSAAGPTAPPQGLYLAGVRYPDGFDSFSEPPVFGAEVAP